MTLLLRTAQERRRLMNKNRKSFLSTGMTSIVLIFVLLCLLTFSVLSLVSAQADLRLSRKNADRTAAYHEAENKANDILHEISVCLSRQADSLPSGETDDLFFAGAQKELAGLSLHFESRDTLSYHVNVTDSQKLFIRLLISREEFENGAHYQISAWNVENTHEWKDDTSLPVLDDESMSGFYTEE